jgi:hypothetical protein
MLMHAAMLVTAKSLYHGSLITISSRAPERNFPEINNNL